MSDKIGVSILVSPELMKRIDDNPLTRSTSRSDFFRLAAVDYIKRTERIRESKHEDKKEK